MGLRPYQTAALEAVRACYAGGRRRVLVVLPTGTGKTVLFAEIARLAKGPVLVLAHRQELVEQARAKVAAWCDPREVGVVAVEMGARRGVSSPFGPVRRGSKIAVASIQSLQRRLDRIRPDAFRMVVVDEAHHATSDSYRAVLDHFRAHVLGVTATPDRADRVSLGEVFDEVAYEYHVRQAIADGWLCPIRSYLVQTRVDFSGVRKVAGELATGEVERILTDEPHLAELATPILRERGERPAIVFAASVAHAHALRRVLNQLAGRRDFAAALDGRATLERRAPVIERFRRGELKVLVNCSLFTEGFDVPQIALVAIARPVLSRPFYAQMVGRGTRIAPGKRDLLVLDFVPANCRHSLVHAVDLVAEDDDELAELAREVASKRSAQGASIGLEEALELARQEREARAADVSYQLRRRNPFAAVGIDLERFARRSRSAAAREAEVQLATPELLAFFRRAGLPTEQVAALTAEEAYRLREELLDRRAVGLCTPRQAQELQAFGIDAVDMYYEEARERLRELKPGRRRADGSRRPVAEG